MIWEMESDEKESRPHGGRIFYHRLREEISEAGPKVFLIADLFSNSGDEFD